MTRPDQITATLERYSDMATLLHLHTDPDVQELLEVGDIVLAIARAANPPTNSESSPEPGTVFGCRVVTDKAVPAGSFKLRHPEPATPAVREDNAIRKWLDARDCVGTSEAIMDAGDDLAARVTVLLADVARLREERDDEIKVGDLHRSINRRAAEALGKPQEGERSSWHDIPEEITALRAALAAEKERGDTLEISLAQAKGALGYSVPSGTPDAEVYVNGIAQAALARAEAAEAENAAREDALNRIVEVLAAYPACAEDCATKIALECSAIIRARTAGEGGEKS